MTTTDAQDIHEVRLDLLHESEQNPREITGPRFEALKYALDKDPEMLRARPVVALPNGEVICGNMRVRAAKELGWERIWCYQADLDDARKREWMLRDNQEYGDWVPGELAAIVAIHDTEGSDMRMLGFDDQAIADLQKIGEPDLPDAGDQATDDVPHTWGVVIDCESEEEQGELLEEFAERGLKCRALVI